MVPPRRSDRLAGKSPPPPSDLPPTRQPRSGAPPSNVPSSAKGKEKATTAESTESEDPQTLMENAEAKISAYSSKDTNDNTQKILRAFLEHLPPEGQRNIATDIIEVKDLYQLSQSLRTGLLMSMRTRKTPVVTPSPRPGYKEDIKKLADKLPKSSSHNQQKVLKETCLRRDGFRCTITGAADVAYKEHVRDQVMGGPGVAATEAAHIIPFSLGNYKGDGEKRALLQKWDTLYLCFPAVQNTTNFYVANINDASNVITMLDALHKQFGEFNFSLEATSEPNSYTIKTYPNFSTFYSPHLPPDSIVRFRNHNNTDVPLPDPTLLEVHATVARILHASGEGERIDRLLREWKDIGCLAEDGSTDVHSLLSLSFTCRGDYDEDQASQDWKEITA